MTLWVLVAAVAAVVAAAAAAAAAAAVVVVVVGGGVCWCVAGDGVEVLVLAIGGEASYSRWGVCMHPARVLMIGAGEACLGARSSCQLMYADV